MPCLADVVILGTAKDTFAFFRAYVYGKFFPDRDKKLDGNEPYTLAGSRMRDKGRPSESTKRRLTAAE